MELPDDTPDLQRRSLLTPSVHDFESGGSTYRRLSHSSAPGGSGAAERGNNNNEPDEADDAEWEASMLEEVGRVNCQ